MRPTPVTLQMWSWQESTAPKRCVGMFLAPRLPLPDLFVVPASCPFTPTPFSLSLPDVCGDFGPPFYPNAAPCPVASQPPQSGISYILYHLHIYCVCVAFKLPLYPDAALPSYRPPSHSIVFLLPSTCPSAPALSPPLPHPPVTQPGACGTLKAPFYLNSAPCTPGPLNTVWFTLHL